MQTRYELLYIIPTTFTDEEVGTVETKVAGLLTKVGATVESTKRLGKLRFAYPIEGERHGHYVLVIFSAERSAIAKLEELLRISSEVLRHLILRADEAGSDQKFDLVQFTEVNIEAKEDRRRRERAQQKDVSVKEAVGATKPTSAAAPISSEELEQKIETALSEDLKEA